MRPPRLYLFDYCRGYLISSKMLFVAGQVSADENGKYVSPGYWHDQYLQIMKNFDIAL